MPRVFEKTKNKGGKGEYRCCGCSDPIVPGEKYYEWSFRYGGTYRQHTKHGRPKNSQLTQSKLSTVYEAIETLEESLPHAETKDDITSAVEECLSQIEEVKSEYEQAYETIPNEDTQSKIDALDSFISELESEKDNLDDGEDEPEEKNEGESDEDFEKRHDDWEEAQGTLIETWREAITNVLGNLEV